jgi:hypothetical protein
MVRTVKASQLKFGGRRRPCGMRAGNDFLKETAAQFLPGERFL